MDKRSTREKVLSAERLNESINDRTASINFKPDPSIPPLEYDETFGDKGRMTLDPPRPLSIAPCIVPTANDGNKFWVTAYDWPLGKPRPRNYAAVARITATGQMDMSFGPAKNGFAQVKFGQDHYTFLHFIHELPDGNLIIAGNLLNPNNTFKPSRKMITKILPTGLPDLSFGKEGGKEGVVDIGKVLSDAIRPADGTLLPDDVFVAICAVDPAGRILFLAYIGDTEGGSNTFLGRLTKAGELDASFQNRGLVRIQKNGQGVIPIALSLHSGTPSRVIIALQDGKDLSKLYLTCRDGNGDLVKAFGQDGFFDLSKDFDFMLSCSLTPGHDRLVVCGIKKKDNMDYAVLGNYTLDGAPVHEFNNGEPVYTNFASEQQTRSWTYGQQSAATPNAITAVGRYEDNEGNHQVLARYTKTGTQDLNFFGQLPFGEAVSYAAQSFLTDTSGRLIGSGRRSDPESGVYKATIFAFKDQLKKTTR